MAIVPLVATMRRICGAAARPLRLARTPKVASAAVLLIGLQDGAIDFESEGAERRVLDIDNIDTRSEEGQDQGVIRRAAAEDIASPAGSCEFVGRPRFHGLDRFGFDKLGSGGGGGSTGCDRVGAAST